jgi:hypothetical protein
MFLEQTYSIIRSLKVLTAIACFGAMTASASQLSLSSASANPGSQVVLTLSLSSASSTTSGFEWTLNAPSSMVSLVSAAIGASGSGANKSLTCNGMTCIVVGQNGTAIPNGMLASFTLQVASTASGNLAIQLNNASEVLNDGTGVSPTAVGGVISVNGGPPATTVTISPSSVQLSPGGTQQFTATVTGNSNTAVTWSLTGPGTLSSTGLYTAPSSVSGTQTATVTATSQATSSAFASATVTVGSPGSTTVSVTVSPSNLQLGSGGIQQFTATVSGSSNTAVTWTMTGAGTLSSNGFYTAPSPAATGQSATLTATSVADTTKSASAKVTLIPGAAGAALIVTVSPTAVQLGPNGTQQFTASVNGNSSTAVAWSLNGPGILSATGQYTAPSILDSVRTATVTATSTVDGSRSASAIVTLAAAAGSGNSVTVSPGSVQLGPYGTQQFTATVNGNSSTAVVWSLAGPGTISTTGQYFAPAYTDAAHTTATMTATSVADNTKSGSAQITLIPGSGQGPTVTVTVSPSTVQVGLNGTQQFTATVTGNSNPDFYWSLQGPGTISPYGLYTAPSSGESGRTATIRATSAGDTTKYGIAIVTIAGGSGTSGN